MENNRNGFTDSLFPGAAKPQPGRGTRRELLLLVFLGRVALLANLAFLLGFHTALVFAFLARGFGLFTTTFRANHSHAAQKKQGADDCTDGLHFVTFLADRLGPALSFSFLDPLASSKPLSLNATQIGYRRTIVAGAQLTTPKLGL